MSTTHTAASGPGLAPVPVAIFLPQQHNAGSRAAAARRLAGWHGLDARAVARLIATYTRRGDLILDLDRHPTIARAARYLCRRPTTPPADLEAAWNLPHHRVALLVWTPASDLDLHQTVQAMHFCRALLHPGGFLLTAVTPGRAGRRGILVTAARTAGLRYHQHLLAIRRRLPDHEPRADAATAASTRPHLVAGRHVRAHLDLLAFAAATTGSEVLDGQH